MKPINTEVGVLSTERLLPTGKVGVAREAPEGHQSEGEGKPVEKLVSLETWLGRESYKTGPCRGKSATFPGLSGKQLSTNKRFHFRIFVTLATYTHQNM